MKKKKIISILLTVTLIIVVLSPQEKKVMANGINRIITPSFEEGIGGWESIYATSLEEAYIPHTGTKSLLLTKASGVRSGQLSIQNILDTYGIGDYYIGLWVRPVNNSKILFQTSDSKDGTRYIANAVTNPPINEWTLLEGMITFQEGATGAKIKITNINSSDIYIDDVVMSKGAKPPTPPTRRLKNLILNPGYEDGIYPGVPKGEDYLSLSSVNAHSGDFSLRYNPSVSSGQYGAISYDLTSIVRANGFGLYSFSLYLRNSTGQLANVCYGLEVDGKLEIKKESCPTSNWEKYEINFEISEDHFNANSLNLLILDKEYNHQFLVDDISLTKEGVYCCSSVALKVESTTEFKVEILDWNLEHKYQIWSYQRIPIGIFGGSQEISDQWVLSKEYTLGNDRRKTEGFEEIDGKLICSIGEFNPIGDNYTVALKVIDSDGEYVGQVKDTFTKAQVGKVVINSVKVDGEYADERTKVRKITEGESIGFVVTGNKVPSVEYSARVDTNGMELQKIEDNKFQWNISNLEPGKYTVTLRGWNDESQDSCKINFMLYKSQPIENYGRVDNTVVTGRKDQSYKINISTNVLSGSWLKYTLSEAWRAPFESSDRTLIKELGEKQKEFQIPLNQYGIYQVRVNSYRDGIASPDDGDIKRINYSRGGVSLEVAVNLYNNENTGDNNGDVISSPKGGEITIEATANGIPIIANRPIQYSYWRRDANGWVLIRDYEDEGRVLWRPNRVGLYSIQVRAKLEGAPTYEVLRNIEFNITHEEEKKSENNNILINEDELRRNAISRTPITIIANTDSTDDLLFKYIISNNYIHYIETSYSPDPSYIWTPGKSGDYSINVLVRNSVSFGKFDEISSFNITVN